MEASLGGNAPRGLRMLLLEGLKLFRLFRIFGTTAPVPTEMPPQFSDWYHAIDTSCPFLSSLHYRITAALPYVQVKVVFLRVVCHILHATKVFSSQIKPKAKRAA